MSNLVYDNVVADMIARGEKVTKENAAYILRNAALSEDRPLNRAEMKIIIYENIKRVSRCLENAETASPELVPGLAQALASLVNAV